MTATARINSRSEKPQDDGDSEDPPEEKPQDGGDSEDPPEEDPQEGGDEDDEYEDFEYDDDEYDGSCEPGAAAPAMVVPLGDDFDATVGLRTPPSPASSMAATIGPRWRPSTMWERARWGR